MENQTKLEIELRVPRKIVIHNIAKISIEDLLKSVRTPAGTMPLMWVNGYAFIVNALPLQGKALDLYIGGKSNSELHYTDILYCEMSKYSNIVQISNDLITNVIDMSKSAIHSGLAEAIKQYDKAIKGNKNANVANIS